MSKNIEKVEVVVTGVTYQLRDRDGVVSVRRFCHSFQQWMPVDAFTNPSAIKSGMCDAAFNMGILRRESPGEPIRWSSNAPIVRAGNATAAGVLEGWIDNGE